MNHILCWQKLLAWTSMDLKSLDHQKHCSIVTYYLVPGPSYFSSADVSFVMLLEIMNPAIYSAILICICIIIIIRYITFIQCSKSGCIWEWTPAPFIPGPTGHPVEGARVKPIQAVGHQVLRWVNLSGYGVFSWLLTTIVHLPYRYLMRYWGILWYHFPH